MGLTSLWVSKGRIYIFFLIEVRDDLKSVISKHQNFIFKHGHKYVSKHKIFLILLVFDLLKNKRLNKTTSIILY
jgi:hypothetical protein